MRRLFNSFLIILVLLFLTGLQGCAKHYDTDSNYYKGGHKTYNDFWGGPYSGRGPRGGGVK